MADMAIVCICAVSNLALVSKWVKEKGFRKQKQLEKDQIIWLRDMSFDAVFHRVREEFFAQVFQHYYAHVRKLPVYIRRSR